MAVKGKLKVDARGLWNWRGPLPLAPALEDAQLAKALYGFNERQQLHKARVNLLVRLLRVLWPSEPRDHFLYVCTPCDGGSGGKDAVSCYG